VRALIWSPVPGSSREDCVTCLPFFWLSRVCASPFQQQMAAQQVTEPDGKSSSGLSFDARLFAAIDAALRPAGMLSDLSRIIVQFARTIRWTADERFMFSDADSGGCTARLNATVTKGWIWVVSDVPIAQFPARSDAKASSPLRVWTVRVDSGPHPLYPGICKPSTAVGYDAYKDTRSITVCTANSAVDVGKSRSFRNIPFSSADDAAGSLYHFTADLSTGSLRVRPSIGRDAEGHAAGEGCLIAEGLDDLGECRASVSINAEWGGGAFTLLCG
jgi:hypothetical protein